jgi:hypothetical protein
MRTCELCQVERKDSEFRKFGRGLRKVCLQCENGVATEAATIADELPEPVEITAALEVLPGFGFRATVENERLVIEQDAGVGAEKATDNIVLSRTEAKVLFAQFGEWAA